jgi:hypothetical protein
MSMSTYGIVLTLDNKESCTVHRNRDLAIDASLLMGT